MKKEFRSPEMNIAVFDNTAETSASTQGTNLGDAQGSMAADANVTVKSVSDLKNMVVFY
ncbi:MAG: hypothetical protein ACI4DP_13190 [Candidatus Ornithomonoglobus sp.]